MCYCNPSIRSPWCPKCYNGNRPLLNCTTIGSGEEYVEGIKEPMRVKELIEEVNTLKTNVADLQHALLRLGHNDIDSARKDPRMSAKTLVATLETLNVQLNKLLGTEVELR